MRKISLILTIAATFFAGSLFQGCMSPDKQKENAQEKVREEKQDLIEAQNKADSVTQNVVNEDTKKKFKLDMDLKIKKNEVRIDELQLDANNSKTTAYKAFSKRLDSLETENNKLKNRTYNNDKGTWENFTMEYNRDIDAISTGIDNVKAGMKK